MTKEQASSLALRAKAASHLMAAGAALQADGREEPANRLQEFAQLAIDPDVDQLITKIQAEVVDYEVASHHLAILMHAYQSGVMEDESWEEAKAEVLATASI